MINNLENVEEKKLTKVTNILITVLITIVTCVMPLIIQLNIKAYMYYAIGICLIVLLIIKRKELKFDIKDKVLLIFLLLASISTIFSLSIKDSIWGAPTRYEGLLMIIVYALLYYTSKNFFKFYPWFFKILFLVVAIVAIYSICQFYNYMLIHNLYNLKYLAFYTSSTMINPNFLATFITIFLPISMAIYLLSNKKLSFILTLALFASLVCTLTRSAWIAFGVYSIIGVIYIIKNRKTKYFIKTGILLICFILIFVGLRSTDKTKRVEIKSTSMVQEVKQIVKEGSTDKMGSGRIFIWKFCLESLPKYALFGCGVDCLKYGLIYNNPYKYLDHMERSGLHIDKAHCEYLQIAVTMGIPALFCYLIFIFLILKDKIKNIFKCKITFIFLISIIGYLIQALFNISVIQVAPFFWILLGLSDNLDFINKIAKKYIFLTKET